MRRHGLAPQQYVLLLALKGFPGRDWATVRELADRLQLRHPSVVELINRVQAQGWSSGRFIPKTHVPSAYDSPRMARPS